MSAYYNEFDPGKAAWLRELIKRGLIADGYVDERSITEVSDYDLRSFRQCHFFAGVGVWSYALRQAGWPDDQEVWTGSCPCQSFSVAGKKKGFADERHLWPDWFRLIAERHPRVVFGEQSASKDALTWLDLVYSDMEAADYTVGAVDLCAAGFGAPHIRQRLYFAGELGYSASKGLSQWAGETVSGKETFGINQRPSDAGELGDPASTRLERWTNQRRDDAEELTAIERASGAVGGRPCPTNGFWGVADWIFCTDDKWRPVESGAQPLAHGAPARVGRLRGYGDAIVAPQAQAFIEAYRTSKGMNGVS
jgi:DNA (cytosine-5)-methyltransferase 1